MQGRVRSFDVEDEEVELGDYEEGLDDDYDEEDDEEYDEELDLLGDDEEGIWPFMIPFYWDSEN